MPARSNRRPDFSERLAGSASESRFILRNERDAAVKTILEIGHIPVGMEMFSPADDQQWKIIQRQIDQSDYYIVLIAHRYGSQFAGISYTEREYDYAIQTGLPVLAFVIADSAPWRTDLIDSGPDKEYGSQINALTD